MPLVIPGLQSKSGSKTEEWQNQLLGKKLGDTSDQTTFAKTDLPKEHRVIEKGGFGTSDFKEDRLNIHLGDDGTINKVTHG